MKPTRWLAIILFLFISIFLSHALILQKTVYGDGIFYFSWVRSIVVDHTLDFRSAYTHFGVFQLQTPTGLIGNKHPVGTPLFWLPWYAQAYTIMKGSGYQLLYQLLVGMISVLAAIFGLVLLYRLLLQSFSRTASVLAVMSVALASNLLFYGAVDTVNSHAVSFFAATVFLSFLFSKNVSPFLTGCALGFCALVRPQDAVLGLLVIPTLVLPSLKRSHPALPAGKLFRLKSSLLFILGALIVFSPQLIAWYALYGTPWMSPYLTSGESFTWWSPHFFAVLFSPVNGLFVWTPITVLALMGFIFWNSPWRVWFLTIFATEVAIVGSWSTWWQGASYSGRMLISTIPVLAFGLAALYTKLGALGLKWKQILVAIIGPLGIINVILIIRFPLRT